MAQGYTGRRTESHGGDGRYAPPETPNRALSLKALDELLAQVADEHDITVNQIRAPGRMAEIVWARVDFIKRAWRLGHGLKQIAYTVNRDRTTVVHHLHPKNTRFSARKKSRGR